MFGDFYNPSTVCLGLDGIGPGNLKAYKGKTLLLNSQKFLESKRPLTTPRLLLIRNECRDF